MTIQPKDFLGKPAPQGYIAGVGRGASGFITRSDIGPAISPPVDPGEASDNEDDGLFSIGPYDPDDMQADAIYAAVDAKMDERRRSRRERLEKEVLQTLLKKQPKIQQQFADLKRTMKTVTDDEWSKLPEVGDIRARKLRKTISASKDRFTPLPDSFIERARLDAEVSGVIGGEATPLADFQSIGAAREQLLSRKIDEAGKISGYASVDPTAYMTSLSAMEVKSTAEISDMKKATLLLQSLVATNPSNASGWISLSRLEEGGGKITQARARLQEACVACPDSEDVWLEASRLSKSVNEMQEILLRGLAFNRNSVKLWIKAIDITESVVEKKRYVRQALEYNRDSLLLWKIAIELEETPEDARVLAEHAVEYVVGSPELWVAFAGLVQSTGGQVRSILNKARVACPNSHEIWIAAARFEESSGNVQNLDPLVDRMLSVLSSRGVVLNRDAWLAEAIRAENVNAPETCAAIVRATAGFGVEEPEALSVWLEDAVKAGIEGHFAVAWALYEHCLKMYPKKKKAWLAAIEFVKNRGDKIRLMELLERAVISKEDSERLWLVAAKELWQTIGDISKARHMLERASEKLPESRDIWLAAARLEMETGESDKARELFLRARKHAPSARLFIKSALLERRLGCSEKVISILEDGISLFGDEEPKLYMMLSEEYQVQISEDNKGSRQKSISICARGLKIHPQAIPLWIRLSRLEYQDGISKSRAVLENARLVNPKSDILWVEAIRIEHDIGSYAMAKALLAKSLQICPQSGLLWAYAILMEGRGHKTKAADALRKCPEDPMVALAVARMFWTDRVLDKARIWLERAVQSGPEIGDVWAWFLAFERKHGDKIGQMQIIERCERAGARYGELWTRVSKDPTYHGPAMCTRDIIIHVADSIDGPEPFFGCGE